MYSYIIDKKKNSGKIYESLCNRMYRVIFMKVKNGDLECFEIIVERYKNPLMNYAFHMLNDYMVSENIVHETFINAFRKRHRFESIAEFSPWIFTIASNLIKNEIKRRKYWQLIPLYQKDWGENNSDKCNPGIKQDKVTAIEIENEGIQKALDSLRVTYKEIIILRDIENMSYTEISRITGLKEKTVKSRVRQARIQLYDKIMHGI